jgi:hypothetical protein
VWLLHIGLVHYLCLAPVCRVPSTVRCPWTPFAHAAELSDGPWPARSFLGAASAVLHLDDASTAALTALVGTDGDVSLSEGLAALAAVASAEESAGVPPRVWDLVCAELRKCHRVSPRQQPLPLLVPARDPSFDYPVCGVPTCGWRSSNKTLDSGVDIGYCVVAAAAPDADGPWSAQAFVAAARSGARISATSVAKLGVALLRDAAASPVDCLRALQQAATNMFCLMPDVVVQRIRIQLGERLPLG